MVASQSVFRGATSLSSVDIANNCCCSLMDNLISNNFPKFSPWLSYSTMLNSGYFDYNSRCGSFNVSTMSVPPFTKVDPCTRTHHEPADQSYTIRTGDMSAYILHEKRFDVRSLCGCDGICNTAELGKFVGLFIETVMQSFARELDFAFINAINQGVMVKNGSRTGDATSEGKISAVDDGVKTIDAVTSGLTFEVLLKAHSILAQNLVDYNDIMFVVPHSAMTDVIQEAFKNGSVPNNFIYDRIRMTNAFGFNFYQTTVPLTVFKPITTPIHTVEGTDVNDCIIGYAVPRDAFVFNVAPHQTPPAFGIHNTSGVTPTLPASYLSSEKYLDYIYTGNNGMYRDFTNMMVIDIDRTRNHELIGTSIRVEAFFGVMRRMANSIVRIALPKKYLFN